MRLLGLNGPEREHPDDFSHSLSLEHSVATASGTAGAFAKRTPYPTILGRARGPKVACGPDYR
jgi:hypothetical protein